MENVKPLRMLVVEDDPASLHLIERQVEKEGFQIITASSAEEAEQVLETSHPHLVLADVVLPGRDGLFLLAQIRDRHPEIEVILLTGHASVEKAVEAIRDGACDYLEKPLDRSRLLASLKKAKRQIALRLENLELRERLSSQAHEMLVGNSKVMQEIRQTVERVARNDINVFIEGESGTGKEIAAEMIHRLGSRANHPLIKVSCAAIPENLLESEMFGHEKGSFTGASQARAGKFEIAHHGVLFLDEIGEMSPPLQAKLLRVLQNGEFTRVGGNVTRSVDVRVISATNINVEEAIKNGKFREDLFYRLNVVRLRMPPLRDRLDDIPLLAAWFLGKIRRKLDLDDLPISSESLHFLQSQSWPGNVRQFANVIERAAAMRKGSTLEPLDFQPEPSVAKPSFPDHATAASGEISFKLGTPLEEIEQHMIKAALDSCAGDKEKAAALLGISARTIYRKLGEG